MAAEDQDSRTEDPTSKRQNEAAQKGNVAVSREVGFAAMLAMALASLLGVLPLALAPLLHMLRMLVERPDRIPLSSRSDILALSSHVAWTTALSLFIPMGLFTATGILAVVAQLRGFIWATDKLRFNWEMLSPVAGMRRLFSARALVEWAKGVAKLLVLAVLSYLVMRPEFGRVELLVGADPREFLPRLVAGTVRLLLTAILTTAAIAAADVLYQRWQHWRSLKMTKQEVKDEVKNADGDPTIKAKQRARRQQRGRQRMLRQVPTASVVVTNPTHYAVALAYQPGMNAPRVVAKGVDHMAKKIRELAEENDVPIVENPPLARALYAGVEIDDEIPPDHYKAVAEIIGYVMRLKRARRAA